MLADYWDVVPRVEYEKLEATCKVSGVLPLLYIRITVRHRSEQKSLTDLPSITNCTVRGI